MSQKANATKRDRDRLRQRVKSALDASGRTQKDVEVAAGWPSGTLTRVYGGRRSVDDALLDALAKHVGLPRSELIAGTVWDGAAALSEAPRAATVAAPAPTTAPAPTAAPAAVLAPAVPKAAPALASREGAPAPAARPLPAPEAAKPALATAPAPVAPAPVAAKPAAAPARPTLVPPPQQFKPATAPSAASKPAPMPDPVPAPAPARAERRTRKRDIPVKVLRFLAGLVFGG